MKAEPDRAGEWVGVAFRLPKPMLREIDEICATRRDQPDRSSAIRELIAKGLEA